MIYLRYVYEQVGLPAPSAVAVHTAGLEKWAVEDVRAEFRALFTEAEIIDGSIAEGPWPLAVRVSETPDPDDKAAAAWGRRRREQGDLILGFYTLQPRDFDVVQSRELDSWLRRKRLLAGTRWFRDRRPGLWDLASIVYSAGAAVRDRSDSRRTTQ